MSEDMKDLSLIVENLLVTVDSCHCPLSAHLPPELIAWGNSSCVPPHQEHNSGRKVTSLLQWHWTHDHVPCPSSKTNWILGGIPDSSSWFKCCLCRHQSCMLVHVGVVQQSLQLHDDCIFTCWCVKNNRILGSMCRSPWLCGKHNTTPHLGKNSIFHFLLIRRGVYYIL